MKPRHILAAIFVSFLWGVNFAAAKAALNHFPTFFLLAVRMLLTAAILLPFVKKPNLSWRTLTIIAFTFCVFHFGLMFAAMRVGLSASIAVVVDQLRVPLAVLAGAWLFGERFHWRTGTGIVLAFLGTLLIAESPDAEGNWLAIAFSFGGALGWVIYNMQIKRLGQINILGFFAYIGLIGMVPLFGLSAALERDQWQLVQSASWQVWAAMLYIVIASTMMAHGLWYHLLSRYEVREVTPYSLLVPVFGVLASVVMLGEPLTWQLLVGGAITIIGVAVVVWRRPMVAKIGEAV